MPSVTTNYVDHPLRVVHRRIGNGLTVYTDDVDESVSVEWVRYYGDGGDSDRRNVVKPTLLEALWAVIEWEDNADAADATAHR